MLSTSRIRPLLCSFFSMSFFALFLCQIKQYYSLFRTRHRFRSLLQDKGLPLISETHEIIDVPFIPRGPAPAPQASQVMSVILDDLPYTMRVRSSVQEARPSEGPGNCKGLILCRTDGKYSAAFGSFACLHTRSLYDRC